MIHHFCTLFDSGYLLKGLAMIHSLEVNSPNAVVHVLCMDHRTHDILESLRIPSVRCIPLASIETAELLEAKKDRGVAEYCWTLSPSLPWYILQQNPDIEFITYLDSDLLFYSPLEPIFDEIGSSSVAIIEHRFPPWLKHWEVNGRFCVEWVSFRRDDEGLACLDRWRRQCIAWCYDRLEDGKMGDQKYLDEWPDLYRQCHIVRHTGAGVAPWNYSQYNFDENHAGRITVDGVPLIFYHFHQFQLLDNGRFDRVSTLYTDQAPEPNIVYAGYESALRRALAEVRGISPGFVAGIQSARDAIGPGIMGRYLRRLAKTALHRLFFRG